VPERLNEFVSPLLAWFSQNRRDLPWRKGKDPYAVWVSEVMLQQTRVKTVEAYYPRFLRSYPTVERLAKAELSSVLGAWSGLGYYRRARALHAGAREVVEKYGGRLPGDAASLRGISGIGRYTAGAIASIAFGAREPLVDGNVARVLARIFARRCDVRTASGLRELWNLASDLVPEYDPGSYNEALMELGATVCTPGVPRCDECPVRGVCRARALGLERELPIAKKKQPPREIEMVALVWRRGRCVLLGRRKQSGMFGGLWEPPMIELASGQQPAARLGDLLGVERPSIKTRAAQTHVLTHRKLHITVVSADIKGEPSRRAADPYECFAWQESSLLAALGLSTVARKVLAACPEG
jgi:A/G-specific adenine glycosylase